jgi:cysteinyl-tRNA synthetase
MSMRYLGETFDIHGGGMDLMFPHHENELAQSESATGKPFVKYWMHNGLTRVRTKAKSGEWKSEDMHESSGNAVRVRDLIDKHGADLIRYLLLSTHYRSPIDFSEDVLASSKKGLATFHRLFERIERIHPAGGSDKAPNLEAISAEMLESANEHFVRAVLNLKMKFLEAMDDDFNTAGAIGVMHELAGEINSFIERTGGESREKPADVVQVIAAATQTLRGLGTLLGLFRSGAGAGGAATQARGGASMELTNQLMELMIQLRAAARQKKDFAMADAIRDGLAKLGITLEDRPGGTGWRKD